MEEFADEIHDGMEGFDVAAEIFLVQGEIQAFEGAHAGGDDAAFEILLDFRGCNLVFEEVEFDMEHAREHALRLELCTEPFVEDHVAEPVVHLLLGFARIEALDDVVDVVAEILLGHGEGFRKQLDRDLDRPVVLVCFIFLFDLKRKADVGHLSDADAAEHDGRADAEAVDGFVEENLVILFLFKEIATPENHEAENEQHGGADDKGSDCRWVDFFGHDVFLLLIS